LLNRCPISFLNGITQILLQQTILLLGCVSRKVERNNLVRSHL